MGRKSVPIKEWEVEDERSREGVVAMVGCSYTIHVLRSFEVVPTCTLYAACPFSTYTHICVYVVHVYPV